MRMQMTVECPRSQMSEAKVSSCPIDLASCSATTGRGSSPRARRPGGRPREAPSVRSRHRAEGGDVADRRDTKGVQPSPVTGPTPHRARTGKGMQEELELALGRERPPPRAWVDSVPIGGGLGRLRRQLGHELAPPHPHRAGQVSSSTTRRRMAAAMVGPSPSSCRDPVTSRNASSSEIPSTSGVILSKMACSFRLSSTYRWNRPSTNTASGTAPGHGRRHRRVHAEHPRLVRAGGDHPASARAADDHRNPARDGLSRTSTEAKNASMSTWRMTRSDRRLLPCRPGAIPSAGGGRWSTTEIAASGIPRRRRPRPVFRRPQHRASPPSRPTPRRRGTGYGDTRLPPPSHRPWSRCRPRRRARGCPTGAQRRPGGPGPGCREVVRQCGGREIRRRAPPRPVTRWSRWLKYSCPKKTAVGSGQRTTSGRKRRTAATSASRNSGSSVSSPSGS
jgi:hypothetical protein